MPLDHDHLNAQLAPPLGRRGLERLDFLLLLIESIDLNGSQSMMWTLQQLGLDHQFPNCVELWKRRCHNPLRKTSRRGSLKTTDSDSLILILCTMAERLYPQLRQLLSNKEPDFISKERWKLLNNRILELIQERMNVRRGAIQRILKSENSINFIKQLVLTLALSAGPGGFERLRASLLDPTP